MSQIIVIPKNEKDIKRLLAALKELDGVKSAKVKTKEIKSRRKNVNTEALLSEKSLSREWDSIEDNRWDDLLK
ncbi:MAG: hypothetical protein WD334_01630 [Chitinophagales bacterium]